MKVLFCLTFIAFCVGCASDSDNRGTYSTDGRATGRQIMRTPDSYHTRAHPASYVTDQFEVPKYIQTPVETTVPFYFKTCDRNVGIFTMTNSRYDCDYP